MLEDQVAYLLQKYLGNYVRGLNKEALKISVWQGDVELTNMQLKPEALNALKLPIKVKAGFLGSVRLKVPWSRLGQEPVLVYLDRIFLLAEPATFVEGLSEDAVQVAKKVRIREMEMKLLEKKHQLKSDMNTSWLGSLINTIIGNLKLSITNIHIRYEDPESNPGHPFAAGVTLAKLSAVTVDDSGRETFATGGALDHIQKSVELERLAVYFDSDISPWHIDKEWEHLLPSEWSQVFELGRKDGSSVISHMKEHSYILQPVTGDAKYSKLQPDESKSSNQPLQNASVNLDDVTICLSKDGYRDILKLADNFAAFNQRLKYAHYRPFVSVKSNPSAWWQYAYKAVSDQMKKASGKLSWEQLLKYASLSKRYVSLYASLLKSDPNRMVVEDNKELEELDRGLDIEVILQWRMIAHKFVESSAESEPYLRKEKTKRSWWSLGWTGSSTKDNNDSWNFSNEDWERLNKIIGYKEGHDEQAMEVKEKGNLVHTHLEVHMKHNASKLFADKKCLAELSCEGLDCSVKLYSVAKVFDLKLGSYKLTSPNGLIAESATINDSLVGVFTYKPVDADVDWSLFAKASPCYMTFLKESIDQIIKFFESSAAVSQTIALETAAAVQMTIDDVKRSAQQQVSRALKDHSRFLLDLDIAAPKITIPTIFCPDQSHSTKLLLDLGNFVLHTRDECDEDSSMEKDMYVQFNVGLSDVSAFLVDGDYHWTQTPNMSATSSSRARIFPVIDKCGIVLKLQQIRLENPSYPSTRIAVRLPSLLFHFSPARYHRLMQVAKIFQTEDDENSDYSGPWNQSDFEGWLFVLVRKGVGNREAAWRRRYCCLVGPFLYVLERPVSKTYKQFLSLRGKQIYQLPEDSFGDVQHILAIHDAGQTNDKVLEDVNAVILRCDSDDSKRTWQSRFQGAIYRALGSAPISSLSETSSDSGDTEDEYVDGRGAGGLLTMEKLFIIGALDELKICFSYTHRCDPDFMALLLSEESQLFEFCAKGGQVELSIRRNELFIGTLLKSLEIEDLVFYEGMAQPRYLARSFIKSTEILTLDTLPSYGNAGLQSGSSNDINLTEGEEKFFEASEDLVDDVDAMEPPENTSKQREFLLFGNFSIKPPSFRRIPGLLPDIELNAKHDNMKQADALDSFVKAQILIYEQGSLLYNSVDNQVSVTLATLSFFCYRPTVLAIMEFVNAINIEEKSCNAISDGSTPVTEQMNNDKEDSPDSQHLSSIQEPVIKGLLGKGKTRAIFYLTLSMATAQIFLMNENGTSLATLSQNNLLTDIKVFPSSFSIKAALGNLKISDNSLPGSHSYFWVCDMRNPGGSSFVELVFTSFSVVDEDYRGYDYSLFGQLSEVRVIYLNRFVQEVVSYFMGLIPNDSKGIVKLKDQVTNTEKWFTASEIEGSPPLKLDLSLRRPIIVMPRRTNSHDYLELDVVHITVDNTFQWLGGNKDDMNAIHLEILTVQVGDINLTVGTGARTVESIIQDVNGLSLVIRRSLRDLLHQTPAIEAAIKIEELKAALSNREYQIITECAQSNISEMPNTIPPLNLYNMTSDKQVDSAFHLPPDVESETPNIEAWTTMTVSVAIDLIELSLYSGVTRDASLATVQASGAWLLYKSNTVGEGVLLATLKGFSVLDDREGTKQEFRLAIGKSENHGYNFLHHEGSHPNIPSSYPGENVLKNHGVSPVPTMLIIDAKLNQSSTSVSLCIQRPQLLVALDFLLALAEFFVPTIHSVLLNEEDVSPTNVVDTIILDQPIYSQPSSEFSLSPQRPLIADNENFDYFIYDGKGGNLYLQDSQGSNLCSPSTETFIYVGDGKRLQFKDVHIKNGKYLDSCIMLGTNSSYSILKEDHVYLEGAEDDGIYQKLSEEGASSVHTPNVAANMTTQLIVELQAIGPELTFYSTTKDIGESPLLSSKLLHVQLDAFCRLILKGETVEMSSNALGLTMESNGVKILEPFDTSINFSSASGKTNIYLAVSDVYMNFSFSILKLFLAVEEDILAFVNKTSKKATLVCSQFDKIVTIQSPQNDQTYAFWRPRAPPGFAILGDYLTPTNKPPTKGVLAVNTNFVRVKRPISFKLIWSNLDADLLDSNNNMQDAATQNAENSKEVNTCSIWLPVAPQGYVALGCVVSVGSRDPPTSSVFCILASLVSPCDLRDCITISLSEQYASRLAFWRVNNSVGSFMPADPTNMSLIGRAYELRHFLFGSFGGFLKSSKSSEIQDISLGAHQNLQSGRPSTANSGRRFETVASFRLVWWNQGSNSRKKLSIWRPLLQPGMVYLGDIAVQGYESPSTSVVLRDNGNGDEALFKSPIDFQLVGQIKKHRGIESVSFWFPQAPPGFVSLGCIACKGTPKQEDIRSLRCIRSDMVTGDQFSEESIWDTSDAKFAGQPFSIWKVGNESGTFLVRCGFRKPPRRFALRLADPNVPSSFDDTIIDAKIGTFSAALFDDFGGLMVPLFNVSLTGIGFGLHGRFDHLNSTLSFSLVARSYNDKLDSWEPLVEPMDGFLRYKYDQNDPSAASQLRIISTRDLNLNISVSNANMILQAYASWNNLNAVHETYKRREALAPIYEGGPVIGIHQRRNYFIIPQNKLGQDIFVRAREARGLLNVIQMPHGDIRSLKVPVSKNTLDTHVKANISERFRTMLTIIIIDGEFSSVDRLLTHQYIVAIYLVPDECVPGGSLLKQQSARTCGSSVDQSLLDERGYVNWNEIFFFKIDSPGNYRIEMMVTDVRKGEPVGFFSSPLEQIAGSSSPYDTIDELTWIELSSTTPPSLPQEDEHENSSGRIRCAIFLSRISEVENDDKSLTKEMKSEVIQISPTREGPWSTVRLSYAAPVACWRLGNDVIASEVSVKDGNRYVNMRSLVSVTNNTDFILDLCLNLKDSKENMTSVSDVNKQEEKENDDRTKTDEFFETEKYNPAIGWVGCSGLPNQDYSEGGDFYQELFKSELPSGWEWVDDWHVDSSVNTADGWVYAPDLEHLKWPESYNHLKYVNYARQRRWIRSRKHIFSSLKQRISVGLLQPGAVISLPLLGLRYPYVLQLRPWNANSENEYRWSSVVDKHDLLDTSGKRKEISEICVSALCESEEILHCSGTEPSGSSSHAGRAQGLWFCMSVQAKEIGRDIHSDPIQDWNLVIEAPLSITNFLPLPAEFSVLEKQANGQLISCSQGIFFPGKTVRIYNANLGHPLYLSLIPQGGWLPIHEAVLLYHPTQVPSKTISLRSLFSERIVQVILEQNHDKAQKLVARVVRVYAPYWIDSARCAPLTCRLVETSKRKGSFAFSFHSQKSSELLVEEITEGELLEGCSIDSIINFKHLGMSASISQLSKKMFGPMKDLSPLGGMDGSVDLYAYDEDGKCMHLFISLRPCPFQSVPTKVISIRPFMTFTNRIGQDIFIKMNSEDEPKVLHAFDSRVSFVYRETGGPDKLQIRLEDTEWCIPVEITKEDTIFLVLRKLNGDRRFLRTEIRGNEEGSRFIVVFRLGSRIPIRIENRTAGKTISIRQSGFGDDSWTQLKPLSTISFSWEDPYGQRLIDAKIHSDIPTIIQRLNLAKTEKIMDERASAVQFHAVEMVDLIIARFTEDDLSESSTLEYNKNLAPIGKWGTPGMPSNIQNNAMPMEFIIELGVVGVSIVDHRPRELLYLYLERVFASFSTGYNRGSTSRFKVIFGSLQLDNQLPLTLMPVLLAPEQAADVHHPVFKMTITMNNESVDGTQIFPYIYIRVTENTWRLSIHEPIMWALVDFYNNLQMDRIHNIASTTEVDPEIRIDLIDISEVRLKLSLETARAERPKGVLGVWSPILSAVGNALKIQVHLRKVMHKNIFMRKSSVIPAIVNRIWRDLIHNPLHLIFSVDVLGMTSSTLSSLSKGFAELSTDGQFLQLRSKQVWSRRITGVGDGILQGTEALAQGVAFGISGVVTKPVESARQHGLFGLAQGLGRAFLGFIVQPVSGALDFFSLTVDGIGASCSRCLEIFGKKGTTQRIRNPRAIHADGVLREYCEREAIGQMILYLGEASRQFGCTEIFKEPSKYAWSDHYEDHFIVPNQKIVLVTNKRVMLLQCMSLDKIDQKPCNIMWDVPWEELLSLELANAGYHKPSHLILHLKDFKRSENFVQLIKCNVEEAEDEEPQAVRICMVVRKLWKAYQANMRCLVLKVPSSQRYVHFSGEEADRQDSHSQARAMIKPRSSCSTDSTSDERRFMKYTINFQKIWSSEKESKNRCTLCLKQELDDGRICSIWRPICPDGYISIGDIAHIGSHPPNVSALYQFDDALFALPVGYDLVWRNCAEDYVTPVSIWYPRAPDGFVSLGCVAIADFREPPNDSAYCVSTNLAQETMFEEQKVWAAPDSYPWACHIYQVQSEALHFIALRQPKEESDWKPMRLVDDHYCSQTSVT